MLSVSTELFKYRLDCWGDERRGPLLSANEGKWEGWSLCFDMLMRLEATRVGTGGEAVLPRVFICAV